jgi:hypothetical protein
VVLRLKECEIFFTQVVEACPFHSAYRLSCV